MSLRVLQAELQVQSARRGLVDRGISSLDGWWPRLSAKIGIRTAPVVGDDRKSWDVLETAQFLEQHLQRGELVLDIGARGSEMLPVLAKDGFTQLVGVDLDHGVLRMPGHGLIDYRVADFMRTGLPDGSCGAVTAISVIEHGYDADGLFGEVSRVLKPGGHFLASFDYWPQKLNTEHRTLFGMSWSIFSADEVKQMLADAARYGLRPSGELQFGAGSPVVGFDGYQYTFAWLALTKP